MFGRNKTLPRAHDGGASLLVQGDPFKTIQGEGPFAGMPAIFVRLWGCHLKCWFCDTDFESDRREFRIGDIVAMCVDEVSIPLVVLTGGEPMRQNIAPLCAALLEAGKMVQVETAGSFWIEGETWNNVVGHDEFYIVCSPKTPGVNPYIAARADAWKYVISAIDDRDLEDDLPLVNFQDKDGRPHRLARPPVGGAAKNHDIYLQPMDEGDSDKARVNTNLCLRLAMRHGYRVSTQLHKQWGLP